MCLPNFQRFEEISETNAVVGYRRWRLSIKNSASLNLLSEDQNYIWLPEVVSHKVLEVDSGIYSYNYYNNNYYNNNYYNNNYYYNNYYYNNNNNYYYYNNNYYNNYYIAGIIHQYGKVAIHKIGYRSQYAKIDTLFNIRESDIKGPIKFVDWIREFNNLITKLANKYNVNKVISYQDFIESQK